MLRLTEVKLPLDHPEGDIKVAVLNRLRLPRRSCVGYSVFRRSADARKRRRSPDLYARYRGEERSGAVEARAATAISRSTPDLAIASYARARGAGATRRDRCRPLRPVRRADPGADGLPADHPGARQGRARAHQGHLGPVAEGGAQSGIQRAIRRRRRGHVLRRQAHSQIKDPPTTAARS